MRKLFSLKHLHKNYLEEERKDLQFSLNKKYQNIFLSKASGRSVINEKTLNFFIFTIIKQKFT